MSYHIAQINIARMLAPLDSAVMHGFASRLDEINALAEVSPGFIWRLKGEGNDATSLRPFDDDMMIVNMSVWESIDALHGFTYHTAHVELYRGRADWFSKMEARPACLWWVPAGHLPAVDEARQRLTHLWFRGITPYAFTFQKRYTPDEDAAWRAANGL
jgi:hypothetical protein